MLQKIKNIFKGGRPMNDEEIHLRNIVLNLAVEHNFITRERLQEVMKEPGKLNDINNLIILINAQTQEEELDEGEKDYSEELKQYLLREAKL